MSGLTTGQLAEKLGVTPGRVSQIVASGRLDGCFVGDGRARRFDLAKAAAALGKTLDKGQLMGNGAGTRKALEQISAGAVPELPSVESSELPEKDPDRYEMARTLKAEEEARRLRRQNEEAEGTLVLASEVDRNVAKALAREIGQLDGVLREGARRIADTLGVDYRAARRCLLDVWRAHRGDRAEQLAGEAASIEMTDAEKDADF